VRRIVKTSRGWIDVELVPHGWHSATSYGEDGWELGEAVWNEKADADRGLPTLAAFLASTASLPPDEAERIAEQVLREWEERRHTAEYAQERRGTTIGVRAVGAVLLLAVLGLALGVGVLIWLAVSVF
jgi:hypothetical protein